MAYIVRVFFEDRIWNLDLETFDNLTIGNSSLDTVRIEELGDIQILINRTQGGRYKISGSFLVRVEGEMFAPVASDILEEWNMYRVNCGYDMGITVHPRQRNDSRIILLSDHRKLQFGRNSVKNDVVLSNKRTSSVHCAIITRNGESYIHDLNSTNGTYLNGKLVTNENGEKLYDGDVICLSIYRMQVIAGKLYFYNTGNDLELNVRAVDPSEETIFDDGSRLPGGRQSMYAFASGREAGLIRGRRTQKEMKAADIEEIESAAEEQQKPLDPEAGKHPAPPSQSPLQADHPLPSEKEEEPKWALKPGQEESTAFGEYTQVGSEEEIRQMRKEAMNGKPSPSNPASREEPVIPSVKGGFPEWASRQGQDDSPQWGLQQELDESTAYSEFTQVGSDGNLDELRKEVLQRGAYQHRLMQSAGSEAEEKKPADKDRRKLCSDDSLVFHLTGDEEETTG